MIGLEVTAQNKAGNNLSQSIGAILTRSNYPTKWVNELGIVFGYRNRTDLHTSDGWKDIITPSYNPLTHKLGDLILDEPNFTYEVIALTQEEIDNNLEESEGNQAREKIDSYRERGGNLIEKNRTKMWRRVHLYPDAPMGMTKQQVAKLERWFKDVYMCLLVGNFRQAKNDIEGVIEDRDDITGDSSLVEVAGMLDTATWLKDQITDYFNNDYDL